MPTIPTDLVIDLNLPYPAWAYGLRYPDGRLFKKFKSRRALFDWLDRHGFNNHPPRDGVAPPTG